MAEQDKIRNAAAVDSDDDGLNDEEERRLGTDLHKWDTDGDSITDGSEVHGFGTNPKLADTDGDGLGDKIETWTHTDPANRDSDGDGMSDGFEAAVGDHPRVKDLNGDPADRARSSEDLVLGMEQQLGVTQHNVDSDGDGFADWVEAMNGGGDPNINDMNENMVQPNPTPLDRFMEVAQQQVGVKYQFGAEADMNDSTPQAFDSSELVEWSAHQAGIELPDGSWNQYRTLHEQGAAISVDDALKTKGALVFGFSSDPLASSDRPARAYVGISLGNGKVLDVSERAGEVRELDPGNFYTHAALIPELINDIPTGPGHPAPYDMLHPSSPLQRDSDGDGMLDVDERVLERNPFDASDGTETRTPNSGGTEQDGPITSPRQVDPTLRGAAIDNRANTSDDTVMGGMSRTAGDAPARPVDDTASSPETSDGASMDERVVRTGDEPQFADAEMQMIDDTVNTFLPPADDALAGDWALIDDSAATSDEFAPDDSFA
jgi:NlpC/P60 family/Bacterial TSP3 repeat